MTESVTGWTFGRVEDEFDDLVLRDVLAEVNHLMCGKGADRGNVNRSGVDTEMWQELLKRGGMSQDGVVKAVAGELISQRDTTGPFSPYTIDNIRTLGDELGPDRTNHLVFKILVSLGRLSPEGERI